MITGSHQRTGCRFGHGRGIGQRRMACFHWLGRDGHSLSSINCSCAVPQCDAQLIGDMICAYVGCYANARKSTGAGESSRVYKELPSNNFQTFITQHIQSIQSSQLFQQPSPITSTPQTSLLNSPNQSQWVSSRQLS
jgi:hypothetical protein